MKMNQRGFTLIEMLAVMAIAAILLIGLTSMIDSSLEDSKGQQAALYQAQLVDAATRYVHANYNSLLGQLGAAAPVVVTLDQLKTPAGGAAAYLPSSLAPGNAYGQIPCVIVTKAAGAPAATPQLNALVVTYGGKAIADKEIGLVAANAGRGGGYISAANPASAQGATWSLNNAALASFKSAPCLTGSSRDAGHLVSALFFDGPGQLSTDFLYRNAVPGRPELNTMNTAIVMNKNAPIVLSSLDANAVPYAENEPCGASSSASSYPNGAVAADAAGALLSCESGIWKKQQGSWKDSVATYSDLYTLPVAPTLGDVRLERADNRAFTWDGVASWIALAVDQNGRLTANDVALNSVVPYGGSCATVGVVARAQSGELLTCRASNGTTSAIWQSPRDATITSKAFSRRYDMDSSTGPYTASIPLADLRGNGPLYVTGHSWCRSDKATRMVVSVKTFDAAGNELGFVGGCGQQGNQDSGLTVSKGFIGLQLLPANAAYVAVYMQATFGPISNGEANLGIDIYNSI
ncbi:shufflon system plasmid conjugative transfer pilus tip adhesin PilV [Collimonas humicola]|uniref:shufflon system plasmid conjugative transfer pilus tip adhesin PilV n=1 Tax=Collimonas humicola TaxID=2825886 RepID=UPI001B8C2610|nr:shufflon system plasmid conjugative transfer pilus tip adhesin PilV [Collimonas humicola]